MGREEAFASLEEALSVVESWDEDWSLLFALSETDRSESQQSNTNECPKKSTTSRRRTSKFQIEKARLQTDIAELDKILATARSERVAPWHAEGLPHELRLALSRECDAILERQCQLRIAAEVENVNLHRILRFQLKAAKKMAKMLRKINPIRGAVEFYPIQVRKAYNGPIASLSTHFQRLHKLFRRSNSIFVSDKFHASRKDDLREVTIHENGSGRLQIDFVASWLLPFPVERVADALWTHTTHPKRSDINAVFTDLYADKHLLVSRVISEPIYATDSSDAIGKFTQGEIATRRQRSLVDGSITLVSSLHVKISFRNGDPRGFLDGDGWLRVERLNDRMSRVQWCRRLTGFPPDHYLSEQRSQWIRQLNAGPLRQRWRRNLESNVQCVENILVGCA